MGCSEYVICGDCGYSINWETDLILYHENGKLTESSILFSTVDSFDKSKCKGRVLITYCERCKKIIKFYFLDEESDKKAEDKFIQEIQEHIKNQNDKETLSFFKNDINFKYIQCPECKRRLKSEYEIKKCFKCGSDSLRGIISSSD